MTELSHHFTPTRRLELQLLFHYIRYVPPQRAHGLESRLQVLRRLCHRQKLVTIGASAVARRARGRRRVTFLVALPVDSKEQIRIQLRTAGSQISTDWLTDSNS